MQKRSFKLNIKNLIAYLMVFAILVLLFLFNHRTAIFVLIVVQLLCLLPSLLLVRKGFEAPKIELKMEREVQLVGEKNNFITTFTSKSLYPYSRIVIDYSIYHSFESHNEHHLKDYFSLFHEKKEYTYSLSFDYCGVYMIKAEDIRVYDLLNIFYLRLNPVDTNAIVMPSNFAMTMTEERLGLSKKEEDQNDPSKGYDVSEIKELREYRDGDRLSQVHWKLSTKSEELIVKEYERLAGTCIMIACDGSIFKLEENNQYFNFLLSFGTALLNSQIFFEIVYFDKRDLDYRRVRIDNTYDLNLTIQNMYYGMERVTIEELKSYYDEHSGATKLLVLTREDLDLTMFNEIETHKTFKIFAER